MRKPAIIGIYGEANSGKTSLIVQLIKNLKKDNLNIATIKITDKNITLDKKGKDTWKYNKAGSDLVVLMSPIVTNLIIKENMDELQVCHVINKLNDFDVIIIEGSRDDDIPKIRVGKTIEKRKNTIVNFDNNYIDLLKIIKNEIK